jgi:hypothetical protein
MHPAKSRKDCRYDRVGRRNENRFFFGFHVELTTGQERIGKSPARDRVVGLPHRQVKVNDNRRIEPFAPLMWPASCHDSGVDNAGFPSERLQGVIKILAGTTRAQGRMIVLQ